MCRHTLICVPHSDVSHGVTIIWSAVCIGDLSFYLSPLSWKRAVFGRSRNTGNTVLPSTGFCSSVQKDGAVANCPLISTAVAPCMCGCCRPCDAYRACFPGFRDSRKPTESYAWAFLPMLCLISKSMFIT